jgi:hypothetical protein
MSPVSGKADIDCDAARYESIHKAVQYKNIGAIQIGIMYGSDVITMSFKGDFQCLKSAAPRKRDVHLTSASNAEESEAAARRYCEGFTARFRVCDVPDVSAKFQKRTAL